jgi:AdoMet-dependent heme synthase
MLDVKFKFEGGHTNDRSWMAPSSIRQLYWHVTYACNYRCQECFTNAGTPHPDELTTDEALRLVESAQRVGVRDIIISGGEPFMRPDLLTILKRMGSLGITARIASNGSRLTDEMLEELRSETLVKSFQISLDTLDAGLYRSLHGVPEGSLDKALDAVSRIQTHGFHTTISTRLTPETLPGIPGLLDRARAESWSTVTVHFPIHTGRSTAGFPQSTDFFSLLELAFDHFAGMATRWVAETYIPWAAYHPVVRRFEEKIHFNHRGCRAGRDRLSIGSNGRISPCVCADVPAASMGNIRTDSLSEVFQNAPICSMLREPAAHGICSDCSLVESCGGGCRAVALVCTGKINGLDPTCPVRQKLLSRTEG